MIKLNTTEKKLKAAIVFNEFAIGNIIPLMMAVAFTEPETLISLLTDVKEETKQKCLRILENYDKTTAWRNDSPYWKKKLEEVL